MKNTKEDLGLMAGAILVCAVYLTGKIWLDDTIKAKRKLQNRSHYELIADQREKISYGQNERTKEVEIVDRFTGDRYALVRKMLRNPWDRVSYEIATTNLLLRKIEEKPQPTKQPSIF